MLNAEDTLSLAMKVLSKGDTVLFAHGGLLPVVQEHLQEGKKRAVIAEHGEVLLCEGEEQRLLISLGRFFLTQGGKVGFHVDNVLAAIAAAWWLKIDDSIIIRGLETFPAETELPAFPSELRTKGVRHLGSSEEWGGALARDCGVGWV